MDHTGGFAESSVIVPEHARLLRSIRNFHCNETLSEVDVSLVLEFAFALPVFSLNVVSRLEPILALFGERLRLEQVAHSLSRARGLTKVVPSVFIRFRGQIQKFFTSWRGTPFRRLAMDSIRHVWSVWQRAVESPLANGYNFFRIPLLPFFDKQRAPLLRATWPRFMTDLAVAIHTAYQLDRPPLGFSPVDGNLVAFLRYGQVEGDLGDGMDQVDHDSEFIVELADVSHFLLVAVAMARKLGARGWQSCDLVSVIQPIELACHLGISDRLSLLISPVVRSGSRIGGHSWMQPGGIPVEFVHPLQRCKAYNTSFPCIRDPVAFFSHWHGDEYDVTNWCLALPSWLAPERKLFRGNSSWMAQGLSSRHIARMNGYWKRLDSAGFASLISTWETNPACIRARNELASTGRFRGVSATVDKASTATKLVEFPRLPSAPDGQLGGRFMAFLSRSEFVDSQHVCGLEGFPFLPAHNFFVVSYKGVAIENPHSLWWRALAAGDQSFWSAPVLCVMMILGRLLSSAAVQVMAQELVRSVVLARALLLMLRIWVVSKRASMHDPLDVGVLSRLVDRDLARAAELANDVAPDMEPPNPCSQAVRSQAQRVEALWQVVSQAGNSATLSVPVACATSRITGFRLLTEPAFADGAPFESPGPWLEVVFDDVARCLRDVSWPPVVMCSHLEC
eukprot:TRINITY_DN50487_c0_g1_i1.p1 TRINITY_DN50487_c0_g1~~TRINITY_DN50487_c0_g1_i1.p1  ORF type:complete len:731 (+),score=84.64 TRINITY_DN50487_c0_g1_i1:162-2195(+)